jgi:hypothetical protein
MAGHGDSIVAVGSSGFRQSGIAVSSHRRDNHGFFGMISGIHSLVDTETAVASLRYEAC